MFVDTRLGGKPRYFVEPPQDCAMLVPEALKTCVAFLGRKIGSGESARVRWVGTGFLVEVPSSILGDAFSYLVTAQHVAEILLLGEYVVRVNLNDGRWVDIVGRSTDVWWYHPTERETVDVAVRPLAPPETVNFRTIPLDLFLDHPSFANKGIGAGDEVFMIGLLAKASGMSRNMPVVRMGNVALLPDPGELIPGIVVSRNAPTVKAEVFLIEARSIGGLSGSPVFVRETVTLPNMTIRYGTDTTRTPETINCFVPGRFYLLGMAHGHWDIPPEEMNESDPVATGRDEKSVNMGIAIVVPAEKIRQTLFQEGLAAMRQEDDDREIRQRGTSSPD
jgi:hypothetical protein